MSSRAPGRRLAEQRVTDSLLPMADQSTQSITVDAPPADVMAVIADFPSYPEWVAAAKKVVVVEPGDGDRARQVHFVLDAGAVKDDYVLEYTWDDDRKVSWTLVKGQMQKRNDGSYTLTEKDGRTEVTYSITIDLSIPMLGMIKRKAEKVILDTALKELKKRVEG
jgi:carbon monoxide dehydrogenase subunit G